MNYHFWMIFLSHMKYNSHLSSDRWKLGSPGQLCQGIQLSGWRTWPEHYYQDIILYSVSPALLMSFSTLTKILDCFEIISSLYQEKCIQSRQRSFHFKNIF